MDDALWSQIAGGPDLLAWFGTVPSFHDGEILSLSLDRDGPTAVLRVHGWRFAGGADEQGYLRTDRHAVVEFRLDGVTGLELQDHNHPNVASATNPADRRWRLAARSQPCHRLAG